VVRFIFNNIPQGTKLKKEAVTKLYNTIAAVYHVKIEEIEILMSEGIYYNVTLYGDNIQCPWVQACVQWFGQPRKVEDVVGRVVNAFWKEHSLHSNVVFQDYPEGTFRRDGIRFG
jgi:hypothetical protein